MLLTPPIPSFLLLSTPTTDCWLTDNDDLDNDNNSVNNIDNNNLPTRVGKRNDDCNKTETKEEETVADSVAIHTTIKQITGRGGIDGNNYDNDDNNDNKEGSCHDNTNNDG